MILLVRNQMKGSHETLKDFGDTDLCKVDQIVPGWHLPLCILKLNKTRKEQVISVHKCI